jgi:hypothetical protein
MTITYKISDDKKMVLRTNEDESVSLIPMDEANSDYQAYLASLEAPQA